jgi:hypothetical protein
MGPIGCPEISEMNYHYTLRNIPEKLRSQFPRGASLKSRSAGQGSVRSNSLLKHFELLMKHFQILVMKIT